MYKVEAQAAHEVIAHKQQYNLHWNSEDRAMVQSM
jgi:hypothetical protein